MADCHLSNGTKWVGPKISNSCRFLFNFFHGLGVQQAIVTPNRSLNPWPLQGLKAREPFRKNRYKAFSNISVPLLSLVLTEYVVPDPSLSIFQERVKREPKPSAGNGKRLIRILHKGHSWCKWVLISYEANSS